MRFVVVYDACVLYPAALRDLLIWLAKTGLFAARWTDTIHCEWTRAVLRERPELEAQLARTVTLMNTAVSDCLVQHYEPLIAGLELPDPDDRHVLAAAIRAGAQTMITTNLKDFPEAGLAPFGIEAVHPDRFVAQQFDLDKAAVLSAVRRQRANLRKPPRSADELLSTLEAQGLVVTADLLRPFAELL